MTDMTYEQIASAILGQPLNEVKKDMEKFKDSHDAFIDFMRSISKTAKNDGELISMIITYICSMLEKFPDDIQKDIIIGVLIHHESGRDKEIKELIAKFKNG